MVVRIAEQHHDVVHLELQLFDPAGHGVSLLGGFLDDLLDLIPGNLVGNGTVDHFYSVVNSLAVHLYKLGLPPVQGLHLL